MLVIHESQARNDSPCDLHQRRPRPGTC